MIFTAQADDAADIADLWNIYVKNTTATFRSELYTKDEIEALILKLRAEDCPFYIARNESLLGFALYKQFRNGDGYAKTMEHTIYLARSARGRGIGRKLLEALEKHARYRKVHSFIGGITAENEESIAFHEKMGFRLTGTIPEIAKKFDRWHEIAFMQKMLKD